MTWLDSLALLMFPLLAFGLLSGYPVAFVLAGIAMFGGLLGMGLGSFQAAEFYNIVLRSWGVASNPLLISIPMFVLMGVTLEHTKMAEELLENLSSCLRRVPGGLAIAVVVMGTVTAAATGIIAASVVMMGLVALRPMLKQGYQKEFACGTVCASSTLGILIPPSIMLILMGHLLSLPVGDLFLGAIIPGLLLSFLYVGYILLRCTMQPQLAPATTEKHKEWSWRAIASLVRVLLPITLLVFLVLGSIFNGWATATEASGVGAAGALLLATLKKSLSLKVLKNIVERSALITAKAFAIILGATAFAYVFRSLGGEESIESLLLALPFDGWGLLIILMGLIFLLGFFFDWIEIVLIILPLFAPLAAQLPLGLGIDSQQQVLWFAILVSINLQTSFLTPPFGFALFYLKGSAPPEISSVHIYRGIIPFVLLQLLGLGLVMLFPSLALWLPAQVNS